MQFTFKQVKKILKLVGNIFYIFYYGSKHFWFNSNSFIYYYSNIFLTYFIR